MARVRQLNRLESVGETLRAALNAIAEIAPEWLGKLVPEEWLNRYSRRIEEYHLPKSEQKRREYAGVIGADGFFLLAAVDRTETPPQIKRLRAVEILKQMWEHQYIVEDDEIRWRKSEELLPAGERFDSPYDPEAHFGNKRAITRHGCKVHLTETCDDRCIRLVLRSRRPAR